jgi:hypothetical protein
MIRILLKTVLPAALLLTTSSLPAAPQPGKAETTFNKKFILRIKPMMPHDQLVKMIGVAGRITGESRSSKVPVVSYHWDGDRKTTLNVKSAAGKVIEAVVVSPRQKRITLDSNGKIEGLQE